MFNLRNYIEVGLGKLRSSVYFLSKIYIYVYMKNNQFTSRAKGKRRVHIKFIDVHHI